MVEKTGIGIVVAGHWKSSWTFIATRRLLFPIDPMALTLMIACDLQFSLPETLLEDVVLI